MTAMAAEMTEYLTEEERKGFCKVMDKVRLHALALVGVRLSGLKSWNLEEKKRFKRCFGAIDDFARQRMLRGLTQMKNVLDQLTCAHYLPNTAAVAEALGCRSSSDPRGVVASVCPKPGDYRILISRSFLELREISRSMDSQTSALIHEITHMPDVFGTPGENEVYYFGPSLNLAITDPMRAQNNADNIAMYVVREE